MSIPPTTAIPMATRPLAPSPVAKARGISPKIVDALVMRIGRKRCTEASRIAFCLSTPASCFLVGKFDDEDTVLCHKADEHDDTDLTENIHRLVIEIHKDESPAYGQRYGEHDDEGIFEALELGGQDEIDEYQCEDKGKHQARRTFSIFF